MVGLQQSSGNLEEYEGPTSVTFGDSRQPMW